MKQRIVSVVLAMVMALLLLPWFPMDVLAADEVNVVVSDGTAAVGQEITVTVTISGNNVTVSGVNLYLTYDPEVLQLKSGADGGGGGKAQIVSYDGSSNFTLTFTVLKAGTTQIVPSASQSQVATGALSGTISYATIYAGAGEWKISGGANQSKNADLSALSVSPGTLTPAFNKDTTTYNITLDKFVEALTVSATAADSKATIKLSGTKMDPGANTTKVTVTAENGDTKVYTIYTQINDASLATTAAAKEEKTEEAIEVGGEIYVLLSEFDEKLLPDGYTYDEYKYNKKKIHVGQGATDDDVLFCVVNGVDTSENPEKIFICYNPQNGSFSYMNKVAVKGASYEIAEPEESDIALLPEGFMASEYTIDHNSYPVYIDGESGASAYVLLLVAQKDGNRTWYQYDVNEKTMQKAFLNGFTAEEAVTEPVTEPTIDGVVVSNEDYQRYSTMEADYANYVRKSRVSMAALILLIAIIVVIIIVYFIKSYHDTEDYEEVDEDEAELSSRFDKPGKAKDTMVEDFPKLNVTETISFVPVDDEEDPDYKKSKELEEYISMDTEDLDDIIEEAKKKAKRDARARKREAAEQKEAKSEKKEKKGWLNNFLERPYIGEEDDEDDEDDDLPE
ncbi:MAG: cadherin-like beta sandwich domain-containing protein [Lachnospiraceae bacterium]|nr:cadherin-like beta sandwich domain-containing protein [Lachnospiraceae bacterium]